MPFIAQRSASTFILKGKAYAINEFTMYQFDDAAAPASAWKEITTLPQVIGSNSAAVVNGKAYCWSSTGEVYYYIPNY